MQVEGKYQSTEVPMNGLIYFIYFDVTTLTDLLTTPPLDRCSLKSRAASRLVLALASVMVGQRSG